MGHTQKIGRVERPLAQVDKDGPEEIEQDADRLTHIVHLETAKGPQNKQLAA